MLKRRIWETKKKKKTREKICWKQVEEAVIGSLRGLSGSRKVGLDLE